MLDITSRQTRDIQQKLAQCWASVVDGGRIQPALAQCHVCAGVAETEFEAEGFGHGLRQIKNVGILF